jgi:hypothetical protein
MADRLGYVEPRKSYEPWSIAWFCDGEESAHIGETYHPNTPEPDRVANSERWEMWTADRAAKPFALENMRGVGGFEFASESMAKKAMAAIKLALKTKRPLNEHETWCLAQGWKPPKGWTGNVEEGKAK